VPMRNQSLIAGKHLAVPAAPGPLVDELGVPFKRARDNAMNLLQPAAPIPFALRPVAGTVLQGVVSQKGTAAPYSPKDFEASEQVVAMAESSEASSCQSTVDVKAFTGRGEARPVRQAIAAVDAIHTRMRQLAATSVAAGKNMLYLTVHARAATQQVSVRWRGYRVEAGVGRHKHLSWDDAAALIAQQPYEMQTHALAWDKEARELNDAEVAARRALTRLRAAARKQKSVEA